MSLFGKKDSPSNSPEQPPIPATQRPVAPVSPELRPAAAPSPPPPAPAPQRSNTILGSSFTIKGDVSADENIIIAGSVDGTIESTRDVTITSEGRIKANIRGATVTISGKVRGNVAATVKVDLTSTGQLEGNIQSPKLAIAESALFKGSIDMSSPASQPAKSESKK
jgi:cytoskeletal protein CcmA (bactofilin family)